jgi:acyl-CoA synthetase (AMP-forming)/AMP-acid ligase II
VALAGLECRTALGQAGDRALLIDDRGRLLPADVLLGDVERAAGRLVKEGLTGRRVGLWSWNAPEAIEAHLAVEWAAATRVPVDPSAPAEEAARIFAAARVDAVIVDRGHADVLDVDVLVHSEGELLDGPPLREPVEVDPEVTLLLYPRMATREELFGVPISYAYWRAVIAHKNELFRSGFYGPWAGEEESFITVQQLMHGTGMMGSFSFLEMGLPQVVLGQFDAESALEAAARHGSTTSFMVPGMVTRLAEASESGGPATGLRRILYGGAPFPLSEMRRAQSVLGPILVQVYGRFEGGWPISALGIDEHVRVLEGDDALGTSCGRPVPGVEVRLRPADGLLPDQAELCVRSPMVVSEVADPDGWLGLGDLARADEAGYLYLEGRLDGMINTGSYHVYPGEVQEAIAAIPGVAQTLVRGEPHPRWGQAVTAYVVPESPTGGDALVARVGEELPKRLAPYKIPKTVRVVERLPESP